MTTTKRIATPEKRAISWCGECGCYVEYKGYNPLCQMDCETPNYERRRTRKRLGYVCDECECMYFDLKNYEEHTCHECY